jgi:two-component system OmpR family sensor kinase
MDASARRRRVKARPLAEVLTRRLALLAGVVVLLNAVAVGVYYGTDRRELEAEAIAQMAERVGAALEGTALPQDSPARAVFLQHPEAYGLALVDRGGDLLEALNPELIPPAAAAIFADDWVTRLERPGAPLIVAGHEFAGRDDGMRMVFVMSGDPAGLVRRAFLAEFYRHVGLPMLPVVVLLIGVNALLIRRGLGPLAAAAAWARDLTPGRPAPPPPASALPAEVADLVDATRRALDRLSSAYEAEARHAAEAAHALRTPVAVLMARLDALPPGETTDRLREDVAALSRTVGQVLAASRAERLDMDREAAVDLCAVARAVVTRLAPFAYGRGTELALDAPDGPVMALADTEGVEVALSNLVENAVLHGGAGPVRIAVGPGPTVRVRDRGPGLPPGAGDAVFTPFWRGKGAPPGGAGLGLSIVERVQRSRGGAVEARAAEGGGACFELTYRAAKT